MMTVQVEEGNEIYGATYFNLVQDSLNEFSFLMY
jgi:hypothetical protein